MQNIKLYSLAFLNGMITMIVEMMAARMMAPYLGASVVVWTILISTVMLALMLGAITGGRLADRLVEGKSANIGIGILCLLAALFCWNIGVFYPWAGEWATETFESTVGATAVLACILLVPNGICFGMIAPYVVRMKLNGMQHAGQTVGIFSALATFGSILGTLLGGIVLVSYFSTPSILYFCSAMFLLFALLFLWPAQKKTTFGILLFALTAIIATTQIHADTDYTVIESPTQTLILRTIENDPIAVLDTPSPILVLSTCPWARQSAMSPAEPDALILPYSRYLMLAPYFNPDISRGLIIGGGCHSLSRWIFSNDAEVADDFELDVVEIDPVVTQIARDAFSVPDTDSLHIYHMDGRAFLRKTRQTYDFVFVDAHSPNHAIPFQLASQESITAIAQKLNDSGIAFFNIIAPVDATYGRLTYAIRNAFEKEFEKVLVFRVFPDIATDIDQNILVMTFKKVNETYAQKINDLESGDFHNHLTELWEKRYALPHESIPVPPIRDDFAPVERYWLNFDRD